MLNLVPSWVYWIAIGVLTAALGAQQVRVSGLKADAAHQAAERAIEDAQRTDLALQYAGAMAKLQLEHATQQQQTEETYEKKIADLERAGTADRADLERVRGKLASFTSGDRRPGETAAAAGQRARDRLPLVGALLDEGLGLEAESRQIIQRRDAEVVRLLDQIRVDRQACSPGAQI